MLTNRSQEKELLDLGSQYYTSQEYIHCQKMLFRLSKFYGFFNSTRKLLKGVPKTSSVLDIGCGGGLFLVHLSKFFPHMKLHGVDISPDAIELAQKNLALSQAARSKSNVSFELQTEPEFRHGENTVDVILATLLCHHLSDDELIKFMQNTLHASRHVVIINDLHRHFVPSFFHRLLSPILFRNRMILHDGLISIRRGFIYSEWKNLLKKAGIKHYQIKWHFPFRWQVILWKK